MFPAYAYLSAYDRHKKLINDYLTLHDGSVSSLKRDTSRDKTDYDVIRENHRFLWDEDNDVQDTWGARLAKKYYDKLFKEYCIADLTYYKHNKRVLEQMSHVRRGITVYNSFYYQILQIKIEQVALRWRTEKEVIVGKGQFECGNKKCKEKEGLKSWEVNFGYLEHGEKKNALVKLRLCPECSVQLNYRSQKREAKRHKPLKRLGTNLETHDSIPSTSTVNIKTEEIQVINDIEESAEQTNKDESKIWKEKPMDGLEKTREEEFEEYLADLLM